MVYRELPIRFDYLCVTCRRSLGLDLHLSIRPLPILRSFPPKHFPYPINTEKWKQGYLSCRPSAYIVCLATVLDTVTARERRQKPVYSIACLRSLHEQGQAHRDIRGLAGIVRRGDRLPGRGRAWFCPMTMITSGGERVAAVMPRPWRSREVFRDGFSPTSKGHSFLHSTGYTTNFIIYTQEIPHFQYRLNPPGRTSIPGGGARFVKNWPLSQTPGGAYCGGKGCGSDASALATPVAPITGKAA